jgi:hypothetical protein
MSNVIYLLLTALVLNACGKKEEEAAAVSSETFLEGIWYTDCTEGTNGYEQKAIGFKKDDFVYVSSLYSDDKCATLDNEIAGRGYFELMGAVTIENVGTGTAVDYKFTEMTWTFTADPSTAVDYAVACESTQEHGVVDILGKTCKVADDVSMTFPKKAYGTVLMQEEKLLITDVNSNGATEEERSKDLAIDTGWTKAEEGLDEDEEEDDDTEASL